MNILDKIKEYADTAHGEQKRKYTGARYIVHPVAVMNICAEYTNELSILSAALLHDVLEDTEVTHHQLRQYLHSIMAKDDAEETFLIVKDLTDIYVIEDYPHLNRKKRKRLEANRLSKASSKAQTVKYADIIDNSLDIVKHDKEFAITFLNEAEMILSQMVAGNTQLYERAKKVVDECKNSLTTG